MLDGIIKKLFGNKKNSSATAKNRLKFALIYDKLEISDEILKNLQHDIVEVISRYFEIDKDALQLNINKSRDLSALTFNTPILSAKEKKRTS
ncbi:MAG: cell division topological specificity factor MinE [Desulfosarcina sp.]|nr:cell division topological specificity factor MinE [Desulfobacterales bacterium]